MIVVVPPSKWPNFMAYTRGGILTTGTNWDDPASAAGDFFQR